MSDDSRWRETIAAPTFLKKDLWTSQGFSETEDRRRLEISRSGGDPNSRR